MAHDEGEYEVPFYAYRTSLPEDKGLKVAYKVHKPAIESLIFKSEKGRSVFAEAIIENRKLGTLVELCIGALAFQYGTAFKPMDADDVRTMRFFYDSIDIDSPLEKIYQIEDNLFWKRLVLAKSNDRSLVLKDDTFDWKSLGISLKYAELVEQCPAEFWPERKMEFLAELVKEHVKEMHINQLQPLQDHMFKRYLLRDSDTDKSDSTEVSLSTPAEVELFDVGDEEYEGEEEQQVDSHAADNVNSESNVSDAHSTGISPEYERLQMLQAEWNAFAVKRNEEKLKFMEERKQARRARREAQLLRRERREAKIMERRELAQIPKPTKIVVKNIFDLPVEEEAEVESKIIDKRNLKKVIAQKKLYDYPPKHCHHIDLRFVRLFDHLEELSMVFHPPKLHDKYHSRYFKFSYDDIEGLASGISELQSLRVFRLRESRMDERKLRILTSVLKNLNVEVIDFGFDYLEDDCDDAIWELFQNNRTTIKSLELEGNYINSNVLRCLAFALRHYDGHLEYLGLARNPLNDEALHVLCKMLPNIKQIDHLNLTGIRLSEAALQCCIADELLRRHKTLRKLDLIGIPIDKNSGVEMIKALEKNTSIENVDCRGCGLQFEIEFEIEVCLQRNRYMVENPYIRDNNRTEEEIREFCKRSKNQILIKVHETIESRKNCLENRPDIAERYSLSSESDVHRPTVSSYSAFMDTIADKDSVKEEEIIVKEEKFVYNPNEFNLEQIQLQVHVPGPSQRYYYLRAKSKLNACFKSALV